MQVGAPRADFIDCSAWFACAFLPFGRITIRGFMKLVLLLAVSLCAPSIALAQSTPTYRVLATSKTSTMQKEMQEAGEAGFRFSSVMGGETAIGGKEVVVVMSKGATAAGSFEYRLLATSKTSTMQKEMQEAADAGFHYVGQTVFDSLFGGEEVVAILERAPSAQDATRYEYRLMATSKTSTMEKELKEAADAGFEVVGLTVGSTLLGGKELVTITRRKLAQ